MYLFLNRRLILLKNYKKYIYIYIKTSKLQIKLMSHIILFPFLVVLPHIAHHFRHVDEHCGINRKIKNWILFKKIYKIVERTNHPKLQSYHWWYNRQNQFAISVLNTSFYRTLALRLVISIFFLHRSENYCRMYVINLFEIIY